MAVFLGGGVWVSLDLKAAAVVVSVEGCCWGCRCAGVCLKMLEGCLGGVAGGCWCAVALDVHSLFANSGEDGSNFDLWKRLVQTNVSFPCYLGSMLYHRYHLSYFLFQIYGGIHHSPLPGPNPWASGPRRL